jgi:tankyrase
MRVQVFDREQISVDILAEMGHEDLKQIGITAFGHRHKLLKGIEKLLSGNGTQNKSIFLKGSFSKIRTSLYRSVETLQVRKCK